MNDAIGAAKKNGETEIVSLLERLKANPTQTKKEARKELGWFEVSAEMFALVVLLCDGLLKIKEENLTGATGATRFFRMAKEMPMELQMVFCHRVVGSTGENIPGEQRELAFKELARKLLQ